MTSTTPAVLETRDLGPAEALQAVVDRRHSADRAEADLLALVVHWVDLHPVTDRHPAATWTADIPLTAPGESAAAPLAGEGTPGIAEYAVEELAAALGLSYRSGLQLVADSVELRYRLPRLWALVQTGHLPAWKARLVANQTTRLSRAAVDFVDRQIAATTGRRGKIPPLNALLHEARLRCDPDQALGVEEAALTNRGVWFDHRESTATTRVTATLDTLDALDLDASIADLATTMGRLGDHRPLDLRRATALGTLAHPQRALNLLTGQPVDTPTNDGDGDATSQPVSDIARHATNGSRGVLYFHVTSTDLAAGVGGTVEKLGPGTLRLLRDWLHRLDDLTIRPVLDTSRTDAVDRHDPPGWMRETVTLRDRHCVFPGCTIDARACDLDHTQPYLSPDEGGPPGQTSTENLACLCRRHHRMKTFKAWHYRRTDHGDYLWHSPLGFTYTVTPGN
jgi:hypothetical protein